MSRLARGQLIAQRYRILDWLGGGAAGEVYRAERVQLAGTHVALKVLRAGYESPEQRERFEAEARILFALNHPKIVRIFDYAVDGELRCYAMDLVPGRALRDVAGEQGLDAERAVRRTIDVLEGLGEAHRLGIVHRDVKPENVLVADVGSVTEVARVVDFGIARRAAALNAHLTSGLIGTPAYMAPEQANGKSLVDGRADLYSTTCMLFELLTGRLPFVSESAIGFITQHALEVPPRLAEVAPMRAFDARLEAAVACGLAKRPEARFPDARAMIGALEGAREKTTVVGGGGRPEPLPGESIDWARPLAGQSIDGFRIEAILGEGGFGVVCDATDTKLGRRVALKLLHAQLVRDPSFVERFRREGRTLAALSHPGIVGVHQAGERGGTCYLALELLDGETLGDRLRRGPLRPGELAPILHEVCRALAFAHERGVTHRDLKPANLFLVRGGGVKVLDFGIAMIFAGERPERLTKDGQLIGTLAYMSPEQCEGRVVDGAADVYSLGCVVFRALAGRVPFEDADPVALVGAHLTRPAPRLDGVAGRRFGEAMEEVVAGALRKKPAERFPDVLAFARAFDTALSEGPTIVDEPDAAEAVTRRRVEGQRLRVDLPPGASPDGVRTIFLVGGRALRLGRARPEPAALEGEAAIVLRVLPCRDEARDPENWRRTHMIGKVHARLEPRGDRIWLARQSAAALLCDGRPCDSGWMTPPFRGRMDLAGQLALDYAVDPPAAGDVRAVLLRRCDNAPGHAYIWVLTRARIGPDEALARVAPGCGLDVTWRDGRLHCEYDRGVCVRRCELGEELDPEPAEQLT